MRTWVGVTGLVCSLGACSGAPATVVLPSTAAPIATVNPLEPWKLTATAEVQAPSTNPTTGRQAAIPGAAPAAGTPTPVPAAGGGYRLTVNSWSDAPGTPLAPPHAGQHYEAFDVTVANTGTRAAPYNVLYFKVKDAQDVEYAAALMASSGRQLAPLSSGDLPPGEQVRGLVVFEVPNGGRLTQLEYRPLQVGSTARVVVPLTP